MTHRQRTKQNFTLVELILVFAVGAAVAFIITQYGRRVHICTYSDRCMGNLSQIGKAFYLYSMSWDGWYPVTSEAKGFDQWTTNAKSLDLLRSQDLLIGPSGYLCPSFNLYHAAAADTPLTEKNVSYVWYEGLKMRDSALSAVASDGYTNHHLSGRFVRGDGSVAEFKGAKWTDEMRNNDKLTAENGALKP